MTRFTGRYVNGNHKPRAVVHGDEIVVNLNAEPNAFYGLAIDKLAYLEDAEAEGRLIVVPVAIGATVWNRKCEPFTVKSVEFRSRKVTHIKTVSQVTGWEQDFSLGRKSLGKTVFLTREEAEAAMKGETNGE